MVLIAAGQFHSLALKAHGTVIVWEVTIMVERSFYFPFLYLLKETESL
ncbi:RCC1-like domain-containing protein [Paenibacillus sinopodophylli]